MKRAKYAYLLEDHDVRRWYENTARGSRITADVCFRRLGSFCESNQITPSKFASLPERELHNMLMDYVSSAEQKDYAGNYVSSTIKALRFWLTRNDRSILRFQPSRNSLRLELGLKRSFQRLLRRLGFLAYYGTAQSQLCRSCMYFPLKNLPFSNSCFIALPHDIHGEVKAKKDRHIDCISVNKRVRALEETGDVNKMWH